MANPVITTGYAGESAGLYLAAALKQSKSLDLLTTFENIKFKRTMQVMTNTDFIKAANCDFDADGTLTLTDKILEPKLLQVNIQLCKNDILDDWQAAQMRAGAHNSDFSSDFTAFVFSHIAGHIGQHVENNIWTGRAVGGEFLGFLDGGAGAIATDGTVNTVAATSPFTATNIVANIEAALDAVPAAVYTADDLYIYMGVEAYRLYIAAVSKLGYLNAYNMQGDYVPMANGIKIAVCPGMPTSELVVAQQSNLFYGTDLISDNTEVKMLDMANLDGSDNIRLIAKFSSGVQTGVGADIVYLS